MKLPRLNLLVLLGMYAVCAPAHLVAADEPLTFVERHFDTYAGDFELEAVREGRFEHPYYPAVDISDFDWKYSPVARDSWWIRVEELRFLLPLIASDAPRDRGLAVHYFMRWRAAHPPGAQPNPGAWREPMTVARRGMVLVYWRARELASAAPDMLFVAMLEDELERHALHLLEEFDDDSNHGLEEAMGMLEISRVVQRFSFRARGLERLTSIVSALVSEQGVQLEHSPGYHFLMLQMLRRYGEYLVTLDWVPEEVANHVEGAAARMRRAGSYLYDHGGRVLQLGDTDSLHVEAGDDYDDDDLPPVLFDRSAAIAVYKGRDRDRRYLALSITSRVPRMKRHYQNDAGALYYADDGETVLGDGGAFEYARSPWREFFVSAAAHNRVFHGGDIGARHRRLDYSDEPWTRATDSVVTFGVRLKVVNYRSRRTRERERASSGGRTPRKPRLPCTFVREVSVLPEAGVLVVDTLITDEPHDDDPHVIAWHTGPDVRVIEDVVEAETTWTAAVVTTRGRRFRLHMVVEGVRGWKVRMARGEEDPVMGWYSPLPRVRRERRVVLLSVPPGPEPVRVTTRIEPMEK